MNLAKLETSLGHRFERPELLERAVTHRSWAHERLKRQPEEKIRRAENELLEFLGDSVLGLVIAEELYSKDSNAAEGDLTLMKHRLVSTATLASIGDGLDLGTYMRLGRGEESSGGREKPQLLANVVEAIIGAVFLDGGYDAARTFVTRIFADELKNVTPKSSVDYKTLLQERLQARKMTAPTYNLVSTDGQPHDRTFYVEANWAEGKASGSGRSIKAAEMMAASEALKTLDAERAERDEAS
jgi:ribonuclease-3